MTKVPFPLYLLLSQPENLLLADKDDDSKIKVADWGIAQRVKRRGGKENGSRSGTPGYTAPEVIRGEDSGTSVDLWAAGVICYILLGGYPPFDDGDESVSRENMVGWFGVLGLWGEASLL